MADPKRVVERHVEAFNAQNADAEPWSDDADSSHRTRRCMAARRFSASSVCSGTRFRTDV